MGFLGGYAACIAAGKPEEQAVFGCEQDFDNAQEMIDAWQLGTLDEEKAKAVKFMRRRKNVRAVAMVVEHLLLHGRLDSQYLSVLVSLADGETTQAQFDKFVVFYGERTQQVKKYYESRNEEKKRVKARVAAQSDRGVIFPAWLIAECEKARNA